MKTTYKCGGKMKSSRSGKSFPKPKMKCGGKMKARKRGK